MNIHDALTDFQIEKIISVIKKQCDKAAKKELEEMNHVSKEIYDQLKKGRKAHDITGDVYIGFSYPENQITGLNHSIIQNGIYYQPELQNEHTVIHIYHGTNMLQSKLVKDRAAQKEKNYICIRYGTDRYSKLEYVEAVYLDANGTIEDKEELYRASKIVSIAV